MFRIEIDTANDAFADQPATELARILREIAERVEAGDLPEFPVRDANGNTVGRVY